MERSIFDFLRLEAVSFFFAKRSESVVPFPMLLPMSMPLSIARAAFIIISAARRGASLDMVLGNDDPCIDLVAFKKVRLGN